MRRSLKLVFASTLALVVFAGCPDGGNQSDVEIPGVDSIDDVAVDGFVDDNGQSCTDQCPEEGANDCLEGGVRTCEDLDDDGCVEWSLPTGCGTGLTCVGGECVSGCAVQECTAIGAKTCDTENQVLECGDFDDDGCLQWGNPVECISPLVCARGFCADECLSECTTIGAKKCQGNAVVTCGDYNSDTCLEWGGATDCGAQFCSSGTCAAECVNECTTAGSRQCELGGYVVCSEYDSDGCLEWGTVLYCGNDQVCSGGFCSTECSSDCTVKGAHQCESNSVVTCDDYNMDGCLEWGSPLPCAEELICSGGNCATQCSNECTVALARSCESGGVVVCNDYNEDGCLEWGSPTQCAEGLVCSGGNCAISCSNDCEILNERQCVAGSTNKFQVCGDYNDDDCLEWGTPQNCEGVLVCSGGECMSTCQDECDVEDELTCIEEDSWARCGDFNDDYCMEWGTEVPCEAWESCDAGVCETNSVPAAIVIDEIMYNTDGSPDTDSFVELWGPPSTDLTGWRLVGVNGSNNAEYNIIELVGSIGADGYFVVAHPDSQASIHDTGDQWSALVDYQNNPDSVQLRYGSTVVDAIGYGEFAIDDFFAGEGDPAPNVDFDHSLARDTDHTDTNNNASDFTEMASPTPGASNVNVNEPPVADLVCPTNGNLGDALTFDASASDDPDGGIATFKFSFGDGSSDVSGTNSVVQHTYATADSFTVTLTVTDDRGASDSATCQISVGDVNAPSVVFIKPSADTQVTQGTVVNVIVAPEAIAGRNITRVDLLAEGVDTGSTDDSAPYEFTYEVPANHPNNTSLTLQARAVDNLGSVGFGSVRLLVRNDVPVAGFTAVVSGDKQITVDASSSRDTETAAADLEVRWDYTNDGSWDTSWSTEKLVTHVYPADGQYTIKMEVRDAIGQTASTTREITLSSMQYIGGTVNTTTWTGTIVITGDVTVPAGQILTVAPGTSIQFAHIDQDSNGIGDYDITINGTLLVHGSQAQPVLFTVYGTDHRNPGAWNRVTINGTGSQIAWAIFEYADIALEVKKDLLLDDSEIRYCREGFESNASAASSTVNRLVLRENTADGMYVTAGTVAADECLFTSNGGRGLFANGGTVNLSDSEVSDNGAAGVEFVRSGAGLFVRNLISGNAFEGVRVWTDGSSDPTPVFNYNNIVGNATVSALVVGDVGLSVSTDSSYSGTKVSSVWTNPAGTVIQRVYMAFIEDDYNYYNYINGEVRKDSGSGTVMASASAAVSQWYDTASAAATKLVAVVSDGYSGSYYGTTVVSKAAYMDSASVREATIITRAGTIDMRHNYFGVFPNVLDVVSLGSAAAANLQGFVGVPFDEGWSKGIYFGGETITQPTTWMGTIYITGDLTFSGTGLTVQAGTDIRFAPVDQDANGTGDYDLNFNNATFTVNGTQGSPVVFATVGDVANGYQEVKAYGTTTSDIQYAVFEHGNTGLRLETGTHSLTGCVFQENTVNGLWLRLNSGTNSVTVNGGTSSRNVTGVRVESFRNLAIDRMTVETNTGDGLNVSSSTAALSVTSSVIRNNGGNGVFLTNSTVGIGHCNIQYNTRAGVRYQGVSAGLMSNSNVKFNSQEGILLVSASGNPAPVINANNLYGNALVTGVSVVNPGVTVSTDSAYSGTKWSTGWTTPANETIDWISVTFTEDDYNYYNYINGMVKVGSTSGNTVYSESVAKAATIVDISAEAAKTIFAGVSDGYSGSYYGTTTVSVAMFHSSNVPTVQNQTELAAATDGGQVDCKANYWGTFPDVQPRFSLGRSDAINFSNFVGSEVAGAGPLP